jgi:hypothetical protein
MILSFLLIFAFLVLAVVKQLETRSEEPSDSFSSCPGCSCRIELDWLICPHCKELLQRTCAGCHARLPVSHRFCTSCGVGVLSLSPELSACS